MNLEKILGPELAQSIICQTLTELEALLEVVVKEGRSYCDAISAAKLRGRKLTLFGAGAFGRRVARLIQNLGGEVTSFLDNSADQIGPLVDGMPVCRPEEYHPGLGDIFLAAYDAQVRQEMTNQSQSLGLTLKDDGPDVEIVMELVEIHSILENIDFFRQQWDQIVQVVNFLADERSKLVYVNALKARLIPWDANVVCSLIHEGAQYWAVPEFRSRPIAVWVDIGSADGGDIISFLTYQRGNKVQKVFAFEPSLIS